MKDSEKIDFLAGNIDALLAFVSAVIRTHHDRDSLAQAFTTSQERQTAVALNTQASDQYIAGQQSMRERLDLLMRL